MEIVTFLLGFVFILVGGFLLLEKPYYLVALFIFFHFYNINLELPGPLDLRGLLSLLLIGRLTIMERDNIVLIRRYLLKNQILGILLLFSLINFFVTYYFSNTFLSKEILLNYLVLILGFLVIINNQGIKVLYLSFAFATIFNLFDLLYSRFVLGQLHVFRIFDIYVLRKKLQLNHNVAGSIASISLIFFFFRFIKNDFNKYLSIFLLIISALGVLLSTSRGAIVAILFLVPIILLYEKQTFTILKKISGFAVALVIAASIVIGSLFLFFPSVTYNNSVIKKFNKRLIEDPLKKISGNSKNYSTRGYVVKDNSEWRMMKYSHDIKKFSNYDFITQLTGLGEKGYKKIGKINYIKGGFKQQYAAHNGFILMWIERGFIGLILYFFIIYKIIKLTLFKKLTEFPSLSFILLFILFYALSHNSELTNEFMYLLFGAIIGSFYFDEVNDQQDEDFDDEEYHDEQIEEPEEESQKLLGEL